MTTDPKPANTSPNAAQPPAINERAVNCNGLEYLLNVDRLKITQKIEIIQELSGFESKDRYDILNTSNQMLFFMRKDRNCCNRFCCGGNRAFNMTIRDPSNREVLHLKGPRKCSCFFCFSCLQHIKVEFPSGQLIGEIIQETNYFRPLFRITGANGEPVFKMVGPHFLIFGPNFCCQYIEFNVFTYSNEIPIGKISKECSGTLSNDFNDVDFLGVVFPMDLDVKCKATLLAATLLIDFMYVNID